MLKVMIVDDEKRSRDTLANHIPWTSIGFREVIQAANGEIALEMASVHHPDLILSDIRMPRMNGIELARKLRVQHPDCRIIYLSAYSDKEYLKTAIQLNVMDYIEKPLIIPDIVNVLEKAFEACLNDRTKRTALAEAQEQQLAASLGQHPWIEGDIRLPDGRTYPANARYCSLFIQLAGTIAVEDRTRLAGCLGEVNLQSIIGVSGKNALIAHVLLADRANMEGPLAAALSSYIQLQHSLSRPVHIAVGNEVDALDQLPVSFHAAAKSGDLLFYQGYGTISQSSCDYNQTAAFPTEVKEQLRQLLQLNHEESAFQLLGLLVENLSRPPHMPIDVIRNECFQLLLTMKAFLDERSTFPNEQLHHYGMESRFIWDAVASSATLSDLDAYMQSYLSICFEQTAPQHSPGANQDRMARKMQLYIDQNAHEPDLSIETIARRHFLSASYASAIFKKTCKVTINQYVTSIRIGRAKQLLADPEASAAAVAALVGYTNPKYFARVFKKQTGMTTSEFRERLIP